MIKGLNKETLERLYIREGKSSYTIAKMFSCSSVTILRKCKNYTIKTRSRKPVKGLTKSRLQQLYIKDGKTTREIAKITGCSGESVRLKCKQFGVPLRWDRGKAGKMNKENLQRLYVDEGKTLIEIASIFNCSVGTVFKMAKRVGLRLRNPGKRKLDIEESTLRKLYTQEGKSIAETAKILGCSLSRVYKSAREIGL